MRLGFNVSGNVAGGVFIARAERGTLQAVTATAHSQRG